MMNSDRFEIDIFDERLVLHDCRLEKTPLHPGRAYRYKKQKGIK